jgi:DNA-binding response OmpR family regulator
MAAQRSKTCTQVREPRHPPEVEADPPRGAGALNVLLVEDDAADTSLILKALEQHPHVARAQSTDAPDFVLRQLELGRLKPDLVLLDIRLPRMDGFTFLSRLRHTPALNDLPVVFLTSSSQPSDMRRAQRSSAADYVVKPESYIELRARLDGVLEQTAMGGWSSSEKLAPPA